VPGGPVDDEDAARLIAVRADTGTFDPRALPWAAMSKALLTIVACVLLAGCASLNGGTTVAQCGNPCASMNCPSAFSCQVDGRCVARCQAEPLAPDLR